MGKKKDNIDEQAEAVQGERMEHLQRSTDNLPPSTKDQDLANAFIRLEEKIRKQWGEIPDEILAEFSEIALLISPPPPETI